MKGLDLSSFFTTSAQANDFVDRLSIIGSDLYETSFDLEKNLQKSLGIEKKDKFITLLRENEVAMDSKQELGKFFEKIRKEVSVMPKASLTLAIEPDDDLLDSISSWFILNLKKQIIIEAVIDEEVIGGAILNYQGKTHDTSIRKVFDELAKVQPKNNNPQQPKKEVQAEPKKTN